MTKLTDRAQSRTDRPWRAAACRRRCSRAWCRSPGQCRVSPSPSRAENSPAAQWRMQGANKRRHWLQTPLSSGCTMLTRKGNSSQSNERNVTPARSSGRISTISFCTVLVHLLCCIAHYKSRSVWKRAELVRVANVEEQLGILQLELRELRGKQQVEDHGHEALVEEEVVVLRQLNVPAQQIDCLQPLQAPGCLKHTGYHLPQPKNDIYHWLERRVLERNGQEIHINTFDDLVDLVTSIDNGADVSEPETRPNAIKMSVTC